MMALLILPCPAPISTETPQTATPATPPLRSEHHHRQSTLCTATDATHCDTSNLSNLDIFHLFNGFQASQTASLSLSHRATWSGAVLMEPGAEVGPRPSGAGKSHTANTVKPELRSAFERIGQFSGLHVQ
ncbi:hypothetical protein N657DRAFT_402144 [Parathielavia appendiculata]|uniref:Uncharacterized protein n=1 Tax=Parathielavia appendiculata TaxID=2587402 RepID=A0AAN6U1L2_9PEZI|nr:hypothetical protein N657DRAFT_402144 [Parathielavia appendiculata]